MTTRKRPRQATPLNMAGLNIFIMGMVVMAIAGSLLKGKESPCNVNETLARQVGEDNRQILVSIRDAVDEVKNLPPDKAEAERRIEVAITRYNNAADDLEDTKKKLQDSGCLPPGKRP